MTAVEKKSPVSFQALPSSVEERQGWRVVLEYEGEGSGPWLVDLSHCPKWDLQDSGISKLKPLMGPSVPDAPGKSILENGVLINRMNRVQASIWFLKGASGAPEGHGYTETTDGQALLALLGKDVFSITEKLTSLNFADRTRNIPFLLQGPFSHIPCQVVVLDRKGADGAVLVACSRGYAHDLVHALLDAGKEFGLKPAGENAFVTQESL